MLAGYTTLHVAKYLDVSEESYSGYVTCQHVQDTMLPYLNTIVANEQVSLSPPIYFLFYIFLFLIEEGSKGVLGGWLRQ